MSDANSEVVIQSQDTTPKGDPDAELKALADAMLRGDVDPKEAEKSEIPAKVVASPSKAKEDVEKKDDEPSELDLILRSREESAKKHAATRDELAEMREREFKKLQEELDERRAASKKEYEETLAKTRISLRDKPFETLRQLGMDPKKALEDAVHEDDPNYQRARHLERELEATKADLSELKSLAQQWKQEREEQTAALQKQQTMERIQKMEKDFIELRDAHPEVEALKSFYGRRDRGFLFEAGNFQRELQEMAPGREVKLQTILDYMVREMKRELQDKDGGTPAGTANGKSNGTASKEAGPPRTLGSKDHSQRRAMTDAEFSKLSPEDQRKELAMMADEMLRS